MSVRQGEKGFQPVRLRGPDEVTAAALRPAAPGRPGMLAVAYTERDASPRAAAPAMTVVPPTNERRDGVYNAELPCGSSFIGASCHTV